MERKIINLFSDFLISYSEIFGSKFKIVHGSDKAEQKAKYFLLLETACSLRRFMAKEVNIH